jgi:outer membrane protein OmpA-like peptidoglycan-associated protein
MVRMILAVLFLFINTYSFAELIQLSNEYVEITVDDDTSGFYFYTTGGDPELQRDKNRNLLFKKTPPTSTTFFKIDDDLTYFGSDDGSYAERAELKNGRIDADWSYHGIEIVQVVELIKGPSTGRKDSMRLSYVVRNTSGSPRNISAEIILDTYLGDRDGIRFALNNGIILSNETVLEDKDVPEYWYAFDTIENPIARIQGTLENQNIVLNPKKVVFSNWRRIFDKVFDIVSDGRAFPPGDAFDSGVGIIFPEQRVENNDTIILSTIFGLYGANVSTNDIFAMAVSSSKVVSNTPFTISVNVMNKTTNTVANGKFRLILPDGIRLDEESKTPVEYAVSNFKPSNVVTISYQVKSTNNLKAYRNSSVNVVLEANVNGSNVTLQCERKFVVISSSTNVNWLNLTEAENNTLSRFPSGSGDLTDEIKRTLDKTVETFNELPKGTRVLVTGYTDNVGDSNINIELGKRRAKSVVDYLTEYGGIKHITFVIESRATEKPIADNSTEKGKEQNRRVDITLADD